MLRLPLHRLQSTIKSNVFNLINQLERVSQPIIKKCEGTVLGKAGTFLKNVAIDYKEVFVETYDRTKANPLKMTAYVGAAGICVCCAVLNPDMTSFRDQLLSNEQKLMLLAEPVRNPLPIQKLKEIEKFYNEGRMRIFSLGVLSFMWVDDHDERTALFEAQCDYLTPSVRSYPSRLVDIGFLGKWWFLSRYMVDYDINPEEFKNSNE